MKKISVLVFILLFWLRGYTTDRYWDAVGGSDLNSGTIVSPFQTLAKLQSIFSTLLPGDRCYFKKGGTFYGTVTITKSGSIPAPITLDSYGSGVNPIFTTLVAVTGFTQISTNIWESAANASLGTTVTVVLKNRNLMQLGRYPNSGSYLRVTSATSTSITCSSLLNTPNFSGAQVWVRGNQFQQYVRTISTHSGTLVNLTAALGTTPIANMGFFFQNSPLTLDVQDEWYYNPATKKIRIYSTTMPTGIEATSLQNIFTNIGFDNIVVRNIQFIGANGDGMVINTNADNIDIQHCQVQFAQIGINCQYGINSNMANLTIKHNNVQDCMTNGIYANNINVCKIQRDTVNNIGMIPGMGGDAFAIGIFVKGQHNTDSNRVTNTGYHGIYVDGSNSTCSYNFSSQYCWVLNDGGGIYHHWAVAIGNRTNWPIFRNIVGNGMGSISKIAGNIPSLTQDPAIYLDGDTRNANVNNNTIFNAESAQLNFDLQNTLFQNNTIYNCRFGCFVNMRATSITQNNVISNNKLTALTASQLTMRLVGSTTAIQQIGHIDTNVYARPIDDNLTIANGGTNSSLAMIKTAYPAYNQHSTKSPASITNVNQFILFYNDTFLPKDTTLTGSWVDVNNIGYSGLITLQPFTSVALISTGSQTTPVITWPDPATAITYGTTLSGSYNHTANVAGTFADNHPLNTVLNAGASQTLSTIFTPTNGTLYTTASKSVSITVNPASASLSYSASTLTQTWTGLPLAPQVITIPAGLPYNITFNNIGATPVDTGTYVVRANVNSPNYTSSVVIGSFRINPAPASITVSNTVQQYDSTLKQVSVVTSPVGLAYTITSPKRYKGTYAVTVTLNDPDHTATPVNTTLTITAGTTTIGWLPTSLTYPTPTGAGQTNAISPKAGVKTYTPPSGTVLNAGIRPLIVDFVPSDTNLAPIMGTTRDITVSKGTTSITVTDTIQDFDGNPKFITAIAGQSGTVTVNYTGAHTAVGDYPFSVTYADSNWQAATVIGTLHIISNAANIFITNFDNRVFTGSPIDVTVTSPYSYTLVYTPSNHTDVNNNIQVIATINDFIHTGADTVIMTIIKATPATTWPAISAKTYPFTLSGAELNLTSPVAGAATYNPILGTALAVGANQTLTGTWTPTDLSNYNIITVTNTITVNNNTATISAFNFVQDYDGTPKSITASTTPANLNLVITYNGSTTPPTNAGSYPVNIILVDSNYTATPVNGTLIINKINAVLTMPIPAPIIAGTALTSAQLQAASNIAGMFTFSPTFGNVPPTGTSFITATFHPTDSVNYNTTSISVPLSVIGSPILNFFIRHGNVIYIELP